MSVQQMRSRPNVEGLVSREEGLQGFHDQVFADFSKS